MKALGGKIRVRDIGSSTTEENSQRPDSRASVDSLGLEEVTSNDGLLDEEGDGAARGAQGNGAIGSGVGLGGVVYKVYKRRFFGLFQLALLNIIVSWDASSFSLFGILCK